MNPTIGRCRTDEAGRWVGHQGHHGHGRFAAFATTTAAAAAAVIIFGQIQRLKWRVRSSKDASNGGAGGGSAASTDLRGRRTRTQADCAGRRRRRRGEQHLHSPIRQGRYEGRLLLRIGSERIAEAIVLRIILRSGGSRSSGGRSSIRRSSARVGEPCRHRTATGGAVDAGPAGARGAARHAAAAHGRWRMGNRLRAKLLYAWSSVSKVARFWSVSSAALFRPFQ